MRDDETRTIEEIKAGINRFYGEGYRIWSKKNVEYLFNGVIDMDLLHQWDCAGVIKIIGDEDKYIEILSNI